jgi:hypothetical protein
MISFTLLTDTPVRVRNFLLNRGIIEQVTDSVTGLQTLRGVLFGLEWTEVPNPIIVTPAQGASPYLPGYVPPVFDSRNVYLVKMTSAAEDDQTSGITQTDGQGKPLDVDARTKLGAFVKNNGARDDIDVNGVALLPAWKITNQEIWLCRDKQGLLGTWQ